MRKNIKEFIPWQIFESYVFTFRKYPKDYFNGFTNNLFVKYIPLQELQQLYTWNILTVRNTCKKSIFVKEDSAIVLKIRASLHS